MRDTALVNVLRHGLRRVGRLLSSQRPQPVSHFVLELGRGPTRGRSDLTINTYPNGALAVVRDAAHDERQFRAKMRRQPDRNAIAHGLKHCAEHVPGELPIRTEVSMISPTRCWFVWMLLEKRSCLR
jgi:hypothetical protein